LGGKNGAPDSDARHKARISYYYFGPKDSCSCVSARGGATSVFLFIMALASSDQRLQIAGERQSGQDVRSQNVTAVTSIANIVKTSLGPVGLDKVQHPAISNGFGYSSSCLPEAQSSIRSTAFLMCGLLAADAC
jgi:hypothetical protein